MRSDSRYELLERVGAGSFATVYRARDTELGREVAIKQIHEQYLANPDQMERYWLEAQLLAQLQHPNIITFFDIDRERGWLIMELMQGCLADRISTGALDLKSVRTALAHCLRALKYLHAQGIVHGDVKPGNMMIDGRKRIKIGDFGLARRVADEDGSLLKGTTKYMAPEVMSDEFGEVGPASDLYSLGFAAYELMCGPNFESLFPGLGAFGRDKQVAWMMWHAAADRRLPEISRVLEGVPEDLAHVVQKLIEKDQSKRYQSADEALSDLNIDLKIIKPDGEPVEEKDYSSRRTIAIVAFSMSLILSLVILLMPSGGDAPVAAETSDTIVGVVGRVESDRGFFTVTGEDGQPREIQIGRDPKILLNETTYITARDLQPDDRVTVVRVHEERGRFRLEIAVARPDETAGYISSINPQLENFKLQITSGTQRGELLIRTSDKTRITINGVRGSIEELKPEDDVTVRHVPDDSLAAARRATEIVAFQKRKLEGFIRNVAATELTIETHRQGESRLIKLPIASECEVTVNGRKIVDGQLLKPSDLKANDRVEVTHHTEIVVVRSLRQSLFTGPLLELQTAGSTLIVGMDNGDRKVFVATNECSFTINGEPAELSDLRRSDRLELTYDSAAAQNDVSAIDALRPVIGNRYAIVIGNQKYDDESLSPLAWTAKDAHLVHGTLLTRYGCVPDQTLLLVDETRVRLEQAIPAWLAKAGPESEVIVYFTGHAYLDDDAAPFLAARDFALERPAESGVSLAWLREQLEACPAAEKLLLLDWSRPGDLPAQARELSPSVMLTAVQPEKAPAVFQTTWAIASCGPDERAVDWESKQHGAFAWLIAESYSGKADRNQDVHLEPTELFDYLSSRMPTITTEIANEVAAALPRGPRREVVITQTPTLFRPDATPPPMDRLSPEAKDAVRTLLANHWSARRRLPATADSDFLNASRLCVDEPDPRLAWGVLQLKTRNDQEALRFFSQVGVENPERLLSHEAVAWVEAYEDRFDASFAALTTLFEQALKNNPEVPVDAQVRRLLDVGGRIHEFATSIAAPTRRPSSETVARLDRAIAFLGDEAVALFEGSRAAVTRKRSEYDLLIEAEKDSNKSTLLELERQRLTSYIEFNFEEARRSILHDLDRN